VAYVDGDSDDKWSGDDDDNGCDDDGDDDNCGDADDGDDNEMVMMMMMTMGVMIMIVIIVMSICSYLWSFQVNVVLYWVWFHHLVLKPEKKFTTKLKQLMIISNIQWFYPAHSFKVVTFISC